LLAVEQPIRLAAARVISNAFFMGRVNDRIMGFSGRIEDTSQNAI
jgi:hypothetical protein